MTLSDMFRITLLILCSLTAVSVSVDIVSTTDNGDIIDWFQLVADQGPLACDDTTDEHDGEEGEDDSHDRHGLSVNIHMQQNCSPIIKL